MTSEYDTGYSRCLALQDLTETLAPGATDPPASSGASSSALFALGIGIALLASCMQALGMNMQRMSFVKEQAKPVEEQRAIWKKWVWQLGLFLYLFSQLAGQPLALLFVSPAVLAPLGAATLVFNALFAKVMVKEPFTRTHLVGTVVIIAGAVVIAIFGYVPESRYELDDLVHLFSSPTMIGVACACSVLIVALYGISVYLVWCANNYERRHRLLAKMTHTRLKTMPGVLYAAMAGVMGSSTLLLGKVAVELLFTTLFEGNNQFIYFGTYAILVAVVLLGAAQIVFLNKGFAICPATIMVPIFFCFFSVFSMVLTICYFEQWTCFTPLQGGMVALGTIVILVGVALLSRPASVTAGLPPSSSSLLLVDDDDDGNAVGGGVSSATFAANYNRLDDTDDDALSDSFSVRERALESVDPWASAILSGPTSREDSPLENEKQSAWSRLATSLRNASTSPPTQEHTRELRDVASPASPTTAAGRSGSPNIPHPRVGIPLPRLHSTDAVTDPGGSQPTGYTGK